MLLIGVKIKIKQILVLARFSKSNKKSKKIINPLKLYSTVSFSGGRRHHIVRLLASRWVTGHDAEWRVMTSHWIYGLTLIKIKTFSAFRQNLTLFLNFSQVPHIDQSFFYLRLWMTSLSSKDTGGGSGTSLNQNTFVRESLCSDSDTSLWRLTFDVWHFKESLSSWGYVIFENLSQQGLSLF